MTSSDSPTPATIPAPDPIVQAAQTAETIEGIVQDVGKISGSVATAALTISSAGLWSAICGFFTALPGIVALLISLINWIKVLGGANPAAKIADLGKAFDRLAASQTAAQQQAADQALAQQIGKISS